MARPKSDDPALKLTITIKRSVYEEMDKSRGDVSRSKYIERAIEARNAGGRKK